MRDVVRGAHRAARARFALVRHLRLRRARVDLRELAGPDADRLLLSEENMLGPIFEKADGRGIYPDARRRLEAIAPLFEGGVAAVHVCVRSYDRFLVSAYAMSVLHGAGYREFDAIREELLGLRRGWPDLVRDLKAVFPGVALIVWRFEDTAIQRQLALLLGDAVAQRLTLDADEIVNASPSRAAIAAALRADRREGFDPGAITAAHAGGERFEPLTDAQAQRLARAYRDDLARLDDLPGVRLL